MDESQRPGTVTFTAPANKNTDATFSAMGTYELRITASGPGGSPSSSDTVIVNAAESYTQWASRKLAGFSAAQQAGTADPDNDGNANLVEFVLGSDPAVRSAGPELVSNGGHLSLRYNVSKLADPSIQIIPQISDGLGNWQEGDPYINLFISNEEPASETRTAEDADPLGAAGTKFMRLKVVSP